MTTIEQLLADVPFFSTLAPEHIELIAGCGSNVHFDEDEVLFREGEQADNFYLVRHGVVSVEMFVPGRTTTTIETIEAGEIIGWSWLFPPYRWHFGEGARAGARDLVRRRLHPRQVRGRPRPRLRPDDAVRAGADGTA